MIRYVILYYSEIKDLYLENKKNLNTHTQKNLITILQLNSPLRLPPPPSGAYL